MKPPTHEEFLKKLRLMAAPQDVSLPILEDLISQGYATCIWNTSASATDADCIERNGNQYTLEELTTGLMHDAPIYEQTHVGCHCSLSCEGDGLEQVVVSAFGIE